MSAAVVIEWESPYVTHRVHELHSVTQTLYELYSITRRLYELHNII